ncbi:hypothetical protein THRCLA_00795 [Thraustotheca clavata]|uniref:RRM domain-containing protein n=1 Tax=Thraustotheca clavata TaxID=74557 RepID=A0A1W0AB20_9STRA|nr:hypothetical protein THRCLA_00795 [Thraustotheca clavata]
MLKQLVAEAKAKLKDEAYEEAVRASTRALELDGLNFQALLCLGKSNFHLANVQSSIDAYKRAADIQPDAPFAWKGILEVYEKENDHLKMLQPLEKLATILYRNGKFDRCQKMIYDLAIAAKHAKKFQKALESYYPILVKEKSRPQLFIDDNPNDDLPSSVEMWLDVLHLIQESKLVAPFENPESVLYTLVAKVQASANNANVFTDEITVVLDTYVDLALSRLVQRGSTTKNADRQALDAICRDMITWCPVAKRAAEILLLRAEDSDGELSAEERNTCESILRTNDPDNLLLRAIDGLAMYNEKAYAPARETLFSCIEAGPHLIAVRAALAEIAILPGPTYKPQECIDMVHGIQDAVTWRYSNLQTSPSPSIFDETHLNVLKGRALTYLGKWSDAIVVFEGIIEHEPLLVDGAIGLAEVYLQQGLAQPAADALQFICSKDQLVAVYSARGRLLHLQNNLNEARETLEQGNKLPGLSLEKSVLKRRLASVYWDLDGDWRRNKQFCAGLLLEAAKLNPLDAMVFAMLGQWYEEIAHDLVRAEKCFLKALSLDQSCELAGVLLSGLYASHQEHDRNIRLWTDIASPKEGSLAPVWALLRLAQHQLDSNDEGAIASIHKVLRQEPQNAKYWAALGHTYASFGRVMAAQKSYSKSISLGMDRNPSVLCELARIELSVALYDEALDHLRAALEVDNTHIGVRKLLAETLYQHAKFLCGQGLYGRSAENLKEASLLLHGSLKGSNEVALWKLVGDVHCFAFYLAPGDFAAWVDFIEEGTLAYRRVTEQEAAEPKAWYDLGLAYWYEAQARGSVMGLSMGKLALEHSPNYPQTIAPLVKKAFEAFKQCLLLNPLDAMAWNALAVVSQHVAIKQFGFLRAISLENVDCAWANLGMLYVYAGAPSIAQKAFLSLQGVNPNNPAMWTGYGLLELLKKDARLAHDAYSCALQMRLDLDILYGVASTALMVKESMPYEQVNFALKKYIERDPYAAAAHNAQGLVLMKLGLHALASESLALAKTSAGENDALVHTNFVRNLIAAKKFDDALNAWKAIPANAPLRQLLASQIYMGLKKYELALQSLNSVKLSESSMLYVQLAKIQAHYLWKKSLTPEMTATLKQLCDKHPHDTAVASTMSLTALDWASYWNTDNADLSTIVTQVKELTPAWLLASNDNDRATVTAVANVALKNTPEKLPPPTSAALSRHVHALMENFGSWAQPKYSCVRKWYHESPGNPTAWFQMVLYVFKRCAQSNTPSNVALLAKYLDMNIEMDNELLWKYSVLKSGYFAWINNPTAAEEYAKKATGLASSFSQDTQTLYQARSVVFVDQNQALTLYKTHLRTHPTDASTMLVEIANILAALGWSKATIRVWKGLHQLDEKWKFMYIVQRYILSVRTETPKVLSKYMKEIVSMVKDDEEGSIRKELQTMGHLISRFIGRCIGKREIRMLMVGLDAAGKTTILYQLRLGEVVTTISTIGFNVETITHNNITLTVWDVSLSHEYDHDEDAENAAKALHEQDIDGEIISVHIMKPGRRRRDVAEGRYDKVPNAFHTKVSRQYYIMLSNLPPSADRHIIKRFLSRAVSPVRVDLDGRGNAFATLLSSADVDKAIRSLDQEMVNGRRISIREVLITL